MCGRTHGATVGPWSPSGTTSRPPISSSARLCASRFKYEELSAGNCSGSSHFQRACIPPHWGSGFSQSPDAHYCILTKLVRLCGPQQYTKYTSTKLQKVQNIQNMNYGKYRYNKTKRLLCFSFIFIFEFFK